VSFQDNIDELRGTREIERSMRGEDFLKNQFFLPGGTLGAMVCNLRAEPTTEYVREKIILDQQPYSIHPWSIVHNGTIANDKELRTSKYPSSIDSAAIVEVLANAPNFFEGIHALRGSYAILGINEKYQNKIFVACNYRPIWYLENEYGVFFASSRDYFARGTPKMLTPYSMGCFTYDGIGIIYSQAQVLLAKLPRKALVVCSGGLDSTVAATWAVRQAQMETELIHFRYGSRAEGPEVIAVQKIADALRIPLTLFPLPIYRREDSPLLNPDSKIAGGEKGAEFAYEWVPARNLVMLSVATAFAESRGIEHVILGNNLEEAGAYPDNEPEFIARFNDMAPFVVGDGKRVRVLMPVGNLMKHEIVKMGHDLYAPLNLTWSCYRAGKLHCGTCGPCFMRRTAFKINGIPEVIDYESA
jgi:7-cyano-7-deazaguanine synthase